MSNWSIALVGLSSVDDDGTETVEDVIVTFSSFAVGGISEVVEVVVVVVVVVSCDGGGGVFVLMSSIIFSVSSLTLVVVVLSLPVSSSTTATTGPLIFTVLPVECPGTTVLL